MNRPRAYQWSYDRSPFDESSGFTRLSIGVFQWLPKSSGKGLKKSSTIRINGFMSEPEKVYAKADELCERLNAAEAMFHDPPKWLQKSYSVPKPEGVELGRFHDGLKASQVRSVREKIATGKLLPDGFVRADEGATFVRRRGEQIQLIYFQGSKYGGSFFVNLAVHWSFVVPLQKLKRLALREMTYLDCAINAGLDTLTGKFKGADFEYGTDPVVLRSKFERCVLESLAIFEKTERDFPDAASLVREDLNTHLRPWNLLNPDWLHACALVRLRRFDEAREILEEWTRREPWDPYKKAVAKLSREIARLQKRSPESACEDWITP